MSACACEPPVVSAALAPGWQADLAAVPPPPCRTLPSGLPCPPVRAAPDGAIAPVERVPLELLLSPLAAVLRGAALSQPEGTDGRFGLLTDPTQAEAGPAAKPDSDADSLHLAAICQPETPVWQPGSSALCLGIPSELPGASVVVGDSAQATAPRLGLLASRGAFHRRRPRRRDDHRRTSRPGPGALQRSVCRPGRRWRAGRSPPHSRRHSSAPYAQRPRGAGRRAALGHAAAPADDGDRPRLRDGDRPRRAEDIAQARTADCGQSPAAGWTADLRYQVRSVPSLLRG